MRPRKPDPTPQTDLFRESLAAILDPLHELLQLAARIDWDRLDALYGATFVEHVGRPGLPTRLMVGLHLLKHVKGVLSQTVTLFAICRFHADYQAARISNCSAIEGRGL